VNIFKFSVTCYSFIYLEILNSNTAPNKYIILMPAHGWEYFMFSTYTNIHVPPMQRALCVVLLICVFGLDDKVLTPFLARVMLVCGILVWMRCEWRVGQGRVESNTEGSVKMVKENYELSQTVMHLSDQHELLCAIRNTGLKTLRYSKRDSIAELRLPSATNRSKNPSAVKAPDESHVSAKGVDANEVLKAKNSFRRGSVSEPSLEVVDANEVLKAKTMLRRGSMSENSLSLACD
jgi:hypothetical protein